MSSRSRRADQRSALFIDYTDLYTRLAERLEAPENAAAHILEAVGELRRYLADEQGAGRVIATAHADFDALGDADGDAGGSAIRRALHEHGIQTRFAPGEANAANIDLALDAVALLYRRPAVETVALVTGGRTYLPLVRRLQREGAHAFVVALDPPPPGTFGGGDDFMDFTTLLSDTARRDVAGEASGAPARRPSGAGHAPEHVERLDDEMLFRTLAITEEHFGQYDEVYLTPLLRKLSDVLGERFDPKALVSDLENAGAVRLEKRRGHPYDYTVLIVNHAHPDVEEAMARDESRSSYERRDAAAGSYADDYDDYDDEPGGDDGASDFDDDYGAEGYDPDEYGVDDYDFR